MQSETSSCVFFRGISLCKTRKSKIVYIQTLVKNHLERAFLCGADLTLGLCSYKSDFLSFSLKKKKMTN